MHATSQVRKLTSMPLCALLCGSFGLTRQSEAAVTISTAATQNMNCSGGVCSPTATDAILNAIDLENLLASGSVEIITSGSGGVQANDIDVETPVAWSTSSAVSLDAHHSVVVDQPISATGLAGLSLVTNDGGSGGILFFGLNGNATFSNLSSALSINGASYTLVATLPTLASAIANNPSGSYALATSYDAAADGTYSTSPIVTAFSGNFTGLGNTINNLKVHDKNVADNVGLFEQIDTGGSVAGVGVVNGEVTGSEGNVGGLAGVNQGMIENAFASGSVTLSRNDSTPVAGGLVGWNSDGTILLSHANVTVDVTGDNGAGGLVGVSTGAIVQCWATGRASAVDDYTGGLVANSTGSVDQSYSTGTVAAKAGRLKFGLGGLIGANSGTVTQSYASGQVRDSHGHIAGVEKGGFVGEDDASPGSISSSYWDETTSGVKKSSHGAGNIKNDPGITGLTNAELESALPTGFDPTVWAQNKNINNGLPYLINNPPPQ
jgi:hypothetical protein